MADIPHESEEPLNAWFDRVVRELTSRRLAARHDAEDATMKAIGEMLRAVEPGNRSLAYVRKAALNNVIKEQTRHGKKTRDRLDDAACDPRVEGVTDHRLSTWESERWCDDVLSRLSPRQREVMECVASGLDNKEIARKLGMSSDAVRRNKSDACKAMRKFIHPDGEYRQPAAPALVMGRNVSRAADDAVAAAASLAAPHRDLRAMSPSEREDTAAKLNELQELMQRCPARAFAPLGSAVILTSVAAIATARISDRDELAALKLIRTAHPHLAFAGSHPAVFNVRRARAEALCELGYYQAAQSLLRGLSGTERQVFGADNPRTAMLLLWAQTMSGQLHEAERGFRDLEARLAPSSQGLGTPMLWDVQCRHSWLRGVRRQVAESADDYDSVIINRSRELGSDNIDALDAGHSKGKMLVVNGTGSQAITILQAIANDRARVQGERHSDTLETLKYFDLARVLTEPYDDRVLNSAIISLEQILRTQVSRHGTSYPMSRDTAAWLGWLRQGREAVRFGEPTPSLPQFRPHTDRVGPGDRSRVTPVPSTHSSD